MPGNKSDGFPISESRVERLLREREIRRSSRVLHRSEGCTCNGTPDVLDHESHTREGYSSRDSPVEQHLPALPTKVPLVKRENQDGKPIRQRLLVVANRLPVAAVRTGEESWSLEITPGGLVSALVGVNEIDARWIGWPGVDVPDEVGQRALTKALAEKRCIPVFLGEEIVNQYYNGYCNNILWPLFHYLGLPQEDQLATTRSFQSQFAVYKKANQMFADVVTKNYIDGDVVWCHDYHLMFLPQYLKDYNSKMTVGWFLHSSFPSSEIHRTLPSRSELLRAVLAADLVGFHTYDYARHFVSACTRVLGLEGTPNGVEDQGRLIRVATFPVGINSGRFIRALENLQVQEHIKELKKRFGSRKVMLGVDRLDTIKGIPQKLLAFEKFLEENPTWCDKVVLLQIAIPTRTDIPEYQKLCSKVHEIVGRINGRFGNFSAVPIHHLDRSLDFNALCALYASADVALITSLRDGMNLVSYEFVACQDSKKGVLILSEFAGAAQSLGAGAILVNPWNISEVAASIGQALNMSSEEREKRHQYNFTHVTTHTSQEWAETFVSELNDTVIEAKLRTNRVPPPLPIEDAIRHYLMAKNRLLILGFSGTITDSVDFRGRRADQIKDMELSLHPEMNEPLASLCSDRKTTVLVLSGSARTVLHDVFGEYNMWLAAENGMFLRHTKGPWMRTMSERINMEWVDCVKDVFEYFTERTPRSYYELRETSIVWNYKFADVEFGRLQARDMLEHLLTGPISNSSVDVIQGSRSVEVRAVGVTKGAAIDRVLGEIVHDKTMKSAIDYVLCIGHFLGKDEDVFTFFEPDLPVNAMGGVPRTAPTDSMKMNGEKRYPAKSPVSKSGSSKPANGTARPAWNAEKKNGDHGFGDARRAEKGSYNVLDLNKEDYFSCTVARACTRARYAVNSSDEVVSFFKELAWASASSSALQNGS